MKSFNGWQRLWVVACFVWGVVLAVDFAGRVTTKDELEFKARMLVEDYKNREREIRTGVQRQELPRRIYDRTSGENTLPELWQGLKEKQDKLKVEMDSLTSKQLTQGGGVFLLWIASCVIVYAAGLVFNWVYRGFRPKTN